MEPFLLFHRSVVMIVSDEEDVMEKIFLCGLGQLGIWNFYGMGFYFERISISFII